MKLKKQASRYNDGKVDYTLLPAEACKQESLVWMLGAEKYSRDNWKKLWGKDTVSVVMASLLRHCFSILEGEMYDNETKLAHAAHIRCNAAMILEYMKEQESPKAFEEDTEEKDIEIEYMCPAHHSFFGGGQLNYSERTKIKASKFEEFKSRYPSARIINSKKEA